MNKLNFTGLLSLLLLSLGSGCNASDAGSSSSAYPSDQQVINDATPKNKKGLIDVQVTEGKQGEAYMDKKNLVWYWDRGVVIRRKAKIAGAPDAVVRVGGLARYQKMGDKYQYQRFLTTYNEYEGIPAPDGDDLQQFVMSNLKEVFVSRDHSITEVSLVSLEEDTPWIWHNANSFSVPFKIHYKEITSYTRVDEFKARFDLRFYRNAIDAPIHALMATEKERNMVASETFSADAVNAMKTLRTSFN
jgi:hypothetical protein